MAGLRWMVVLSVFVWTHTADADLKPKDLAELVKKLLDEYTPTYEDRHWPMFSVAVSIPLNKETNKYDIEQVFKEDLPDNVKNAMLTCQVYTSKRVVAAAVLKYDNAKTDCPNEEVKWDYVRNKNNCPDVKIFADFDDPSKCSESKINALCKSENSLSDHAEKRVLSEFQALAPEDKQTDLMLFYVLQNPCSSRCLNPDKRHLNILEEIGSIKEWTNYAFVFSGVYFPSLIGATDIKAQTTEGLLKLGGKIGLKNIYRCPYDYCVRCSFKDAEDKVYEQCVAEKF